MSDEQTITEPLTINTSEAAALLGVGVGAFYRKYFLEQLAEAGITPVRLGKSRRWIRQEIMDFPQRAERLQ